MRDQQSLPCPDCQAPIYLTLKKLLNGESIACSSCGTVIKIPSQSMSIVQDTIAKSKQLKGNSSRDLSGTNIE